MTWLPTILMLAAAGALVFIARRAATDARRRDSAQAEAVVSFAEAVELLREETKVRRRIVFDAEKMQGAAEGLLRVATQKHSEAIESEDDADWWKRGGKETEL